MRGLDANRADLESAIVYDNQIDRIAKRPYKSREQLHYTQKEPARQFAPPALIQTARQSVLLSSTNIPPRTRRAPAPAAGSAA